MKEDFNEAVKIVTAEDIRKELDAYAEETLGVDLSSEDEDT